MQKTHIHQGYMAEDAQTLGWIMPDEVMPSMEDNEATLADHQS